MHDSRRQPDPEHGRVCPRVVFRYRQSRPGGRT
jgi:hypothetical protein